MVLRSSYTQSVFSVYPIYTEDIIERYLIKSVNVSGGSASRTSREVRQVGVRAAQAEKGDRWECEPHGQRSGTGGSASRTGRDVRRVGVRAARAEMWDRWDRWDRWDVTKPV